MINDKCEDGKDVNKAFPSVTRKYLGYGGHARLLMIG